MALTQVPCKIWSRANDQMAGQTSVTPNHEGNLHDLTRHRCSTPQNPIPLISGTKMKQLRFQSYFKSFDILIYSDEIYPISTYKFILKYSVANPDIARNWHCAKNESGLLFVTVYGTTK